MQKKAQLCEMDKLMTVNEAWDKFYRELNNKLKPDGHQSGRIPHEIQQAHYARLGKASSPLGIKRMQRLFDKYAPGEYVVIAAVSVKEAP